MSLVAFLFHVVLFSFLPLSRTSARQRLHASTAASSQPVTYLITQFDTPPWAPGLCVKFSFLASLLSHLHFLFTRSLYCAVVFTPLWLLILPTRRKERKKITFLMEKQKRRKGEKSDASGKRVKNKEGVREERTGGSLQSLTAISAPQCVSAAQIK